MKEIEKKVFTLRKSLCSAYTDGDLVINEEDFGEDLKAMLLAMFIIYKDNVVVEQEEDLIGFTHILNRMAIDFMTEDLEELKKAQETSGGDTNGK